MFSKAKKKKKKDAERPSRRFFNYSQQQRHYKKVHESFSSVFSFNFEQIFAPLAIF